MPRLLGVDIPGEKPISVALRYIYGIGPVNASEILQRAAIAPTVKAKDLTEGDLAKITSTVVDGKYVIEGDLRAEMGINLKRLQGLKRNFRTLRASAAHKGLSKASPTVLRERDRQARREFVAATQGNAVSVVKNKGGEWKVAATGSATLRRGVLRRKGADEGRPHPVVIVPVVTKKKVRPPKGRPAPRWQAVRVPKSTMAAIEKSLTATAQLSHDLRAANERLAHALDRLDRVLDMSR